MPKVGFNHQAVALRPVELDVSAIVGLQGWENMSEEATLESRMSVELRQLLLALIED